MYVSRYNIVLPVDEEGVFILMNCLSSAMDIVDSDVVETLENVAKGNDNYDTETVAQLRRRGYLHNEEEDEERYLNSRFKEYEDRIGKSSPVFYLYPTYACNLRCSYCFQDHDTLRATVMDNNCLQSAFESMDYLVRESPSQGAPYFVLFGGEPLLKRKSQISIIREVLEHCSYRSWKPKIVSNGVELDFYTDILASFDLEYIQVTIDGPETIHNRRRISPHHKGTFLRIIRGVQKAVDNGMKVAIRINVDAENIPFLPELARFFIEKGWEDEKLIVPYMAAMRDISCMEYAHRLPEHEALHRIYELYKKNGEMRVIKLIGWVGVEVFRQVLSSGHLPSPQFKFCGASMTRYCFDPYGDIYTCIDSAGIEKCKVGTFYPIFHLDKESLEQWRNRSIMQLAGCSCCKLALVCGGGCPKLALDKRGSLSLPFCSDVEEILRESARYYYPFLKKVVE